MIIATIALSKSIGECPAILPKGMRSPSTELLLCNVTFLITAATSVNAKAISSDFSVFFLIKSSADLHLLSFLPCMVHSAKLHFHVAKRV